MEIGRREALKPGRDRKNTEVNDGQSGAERYDSWKFKTGARRGVVIREPVAGMAGSKMRHHLRGGHMLCAGICALAVGREGPAYGTAEAES